MQVWRQNSQASYPKNAIVNYNNRYFTSLSKHGNIVSPVDIKYFLFYKLFHKIHQTRKIMLVIVNIIIVVEDFVLFNTINIVPYSLILIQSLVISVIMTVKTYRINNYYQ